MAAAVLLGVLATAALPPLHLIPALWLALPGLVWLTDGTRGPRGAFAVGWLFGLGHFSAGLYWIAHALLTEPEKFAWMIPFAVLGLGAVLAVFVGLAAAAARLAAAGPARVLALAGAWGLGEWLRSWVFTGFPWNLVATAWAPLPPMLQPAAFVGTLGLGVLTVAVAAMPAVLGNAGPRRWRWGWVAGAHAVLALLWAGGTARLDTAPPAPGNDAPVVRIVQANIAQSHKWRDDLRQRHLLRHVQLSRAPGFDGVDVVVWPETAAPYFLGHDAESRALVASAAPADGVVITGAPRSTPPGQEPFHVWNSLQVIDARGRLLATYDKAHLVPFGEYVPFRDVLPLEKITPGGVDFSAGPGPRTLSVAAAGLPSFSPLICYEAIFPGAVVDRDERPAFLLNVTNDGWFGISAGPYQHLAAARMRAVEEGLPLVRAANTGISIVVDALGQTVARLPLGEVGVLDSPLPSPLETTTLFARHPLAAPLTVVFAALLSSYLLGRYINRFQ